MYEIYLHGRKQKEYKYKIQVYVWLVMHGHIWNGHKHGSWPKSYVEIREVKDPELEEGYYYIKLNNGKKVIDEYVYWYKEDGSIKEKSFLTYCDYDIAKVLEKVPSYKEWKRGKLK